ncbi:hypothetical protein Tco_0664815, partial [Tanacetum coccineum]
MLIPQKQSCAYSAETIVNLFRSVGDSVLGSSSTTVRRSSQLRLYHLARFIEKVQPGIAKRRLGDVDLGSSNKAAVEAYCNIAGGPYKRCTTKFRLAVFQAREPERTLARLQLFVILWDEATSIVRSERVSPWEIETYTSRPIIFNKLGSTDELIFLVNQQALYILLFLCVQLLDIPCLKSNDALESGVRLRVYALRVLYLIFCSKVYVQ